MTGYIYFLSYEVESNIFYIGATTNPPGRLKSHRTKFGYLTSINIIEEIDFTDKLQLIRLEEYWNSQFKQWGFVLKNKDCYPRRKNKNMTTDWKGNEIKEGDFICFIRVNIHHMKTVLKFQGFDEFVQESKDEECWILGDYMKVEKDSGGCLFITKTTLSEGFTFNLKVRLDDPFPFSNSRDFIIAISGVSDNKGSIGMVADS